MYMLNKFGFSIEVLESLSYKSELEISFKRSLGRFNKGKVIVDINKARLWYNQLHQIFWLLYITLWVMYNNIKMTV